MKYEFGKFGGQFVPPIVVNALNELEKAFNEAMNDESFIEEYKYYLKNYVGRPSPLYYAERLSTKYGGAKIYLKREDLNHMGAHKINNTIGQILLAKRMGKTKIIAETGAGQHGHMLAIACRQAMVIRAGLVVVAVLCGDAFRKAAQDQTHLVENRRGQGAVVVSGERQADQRGVGQGQTLSAQ